MGKKSSSASDEHMTTKATETGTILWISIGLGTVASLPLLSGMANGTVSVARGAMWFLVTTLVAMVGVWTIAWLMHVFSDPFPDDEADDARDDVVESASNRSERNADPAPTFEADADDAPTTPAAAPAPAMSETP